MITYLLDDSNSEKQSKTTNSYMSHGLNLHFSYACNYWLCWQRWKGFRKHGAKKDSWVDENCKLEKFYPLGVTYISKQNHKYKSSWQNIITFIKSLMEVLRSIKKKLFFVLKTGILSFHKIDTESEPIMKLDWCWILIWNLKWDQVWICICLDFGTLSFGSFRVLKHQSYLKWDPYETGNLENFM